MITPAESQSNEDNYLAALSRYRESRMSAIDAAMRNLEGSLSTSFDIREMSVSSDVA